MFTKAVPGLGRGDLHDHGWLDIDSPREIGVAQGVRTEGDLLRPFDVPLTARSGSVQAALVPPEVSRTVADVTLLVVRPKYLESGMGYLAMALPHLGPWPDAAR